MKSTNCQLDEAKNVGKGVGNFEPLLGRDDRAADLQVDEQLSGPGLSNADNNEGKNELEHVCDQVLNDTGAGNRVFDAALGCFAAVNGILFGYDLGVISGALESVASEFSLSDFGQEIMVSSLLVGALFGSPLGGIACDRLGRRKSLLIASALYCQGKSEL